MKNKRLLMMVEIAVFAGISTVLGMFSISLPQGGSFSLEMLPIVLIAFRWGLTGGCVTGLLVGWINLLLAPKIYTPVQGLIDYFIAFTVVGLAALWRSGVIKAPNVQHRIIAIVIGTVVGGLLRYMAHVWSGAVFFAEYAGDQNAWVYSFVYNSLYMVPSIIVVAIVAALVFSKAPKLLQVK